MSVKDLYRNSFNYIKTHYKPALLWITSFWRRYKYQSILSFLIFLVVIVLYHYIKKVQFVNFYNEIYTDTKPFYIRNIAIVLAAIATAIFTWWKNNLNQRQTELQESTRQDGLFAQAVGFLKEENDLTTRKAGVHILKDLAVTSPKHAQKCIDMLCSLNETWMPKFLLQYPRFFELNKDFPNIKNLDLLMLNTPENKNDLDQTISNIENIKVERNNIALSQLVLVSISEIFNYISQAIEFKGPYDLSYKFLCGGNFDRFDFRKFKNMSGVNFCSAKLYYSNFNYCNLNYSILDSANLGFSKLEHTEFTKADLNSTDLYEASLKYSYLFGADFQYANIKKASFFYAELGATDFRNVNNSDEALFDKNKIDAIFTENDYKRYHPDKK